MIQKCPMCGRPHDSQHHDEDWVFAARCGRLVWSRRESETGDLELLLLDTAGEDPVSWPPT
jgi:hypothetical protein